MAARRKGARGSKAGGPARKAGAGRPKGARGHQASDVQAKPKPTRARRRPDAKRPAPSAETPRRVAAARPVPVGRVAHYYPQRGVAQLALQGPIRRGDVLHIRGQTTDLLQPVEALRRDGRPVKTAEAAQTVTLAVVERVRPGDRLYRLEFTESAEPAT